MTGNDNILTQQTKNMKKSTAQFCPVNSGGAFLGALQLSSLKGGRVGFLNFYKLF